MSRHQTKEKQYGRLSSHPIKVRGKTKKKKTDENSPGLFMRTCWSSSISGGIDFRASAVGKQHIYMNIITRFITKNCATSKIEPLRLVDARMVDTLAHSLIHTAKNTAIAKTHTTVNKNTVHPRSSTIPFPMGFSYCFVFLFHFSFNFFIV